MVVSIGGSTGVSSVGGSDYGANGPAGNANVSNVLLPDPIEIGLMSGDPGVEIAMMMIKSAKQNKGLAHAMRESEERAQESAENAQLSAMRDKANTDYVTGMVGGFTSIGTGMMSMSVSCAELSHAPNVGAAKNMVESSAKLTEGTMGLLTTTLKADAAQFETESTHQSQIAGRHKRAADDARDDERDQKDMINRAVGYYKDYLSAKNETQRAAIVKM